MAQSDRDFLLQPSNGFTFLATLEGPPVWAGFNQSELPHIVSAVPRACFDDILQSFLTALQAKGVSGKLTSGS